MPQGFHFGHTSLLNNKIFYDFPCVLSYRQVHQTSIDNQPIQPFAFFTRSGSQFWFTFNQQFHHLQVFRQNRSFDSCITPQSGISATIKKKLNQAGKTCMNGSEQWIAVIRIRERFHKRKRDGRIFHGRS